MHCLMRAILLSRRTVVLTADPYALFARQDQLEARLKSLTASESSMKVSRRGGGAWQGCMVGHVVHRTSNSRPVTRHLTASTHFHSCLPRFQDELAKTKSARSAAESQSAERQQQITALQAELEAAKKKVRERVRACVRAGGYRHTGWGPQVYTKFLRNRTVNSRLPPTTQTRPPAAQSIPLMHHPPTLTL